MPEDRSRHPVDGLPYYSRLFKAAVAENVRDYFAQNRHLMIAGYWLIGRSKRHPLIPAWTYWTRSEPGNEDNRLDRWPLPILAGEIGGDIADPLDIFGAVVRQLLQPRGGLTVEAEYRYQLADLRHARLYRPDEPAVNPHRRIDPLTAPIPIFGNRE